MERYGRGAVGGTAVIRPTDSKYIDYPSLREVHGMKTNVSQYSDSTASHHLDSAKTHVQDLSARPGDSYPAYPRAWDRSSPHDCYTAPDPGIPSLINSGNDPRTSKVISRPHPDVEPSFRERPSRQQVSRISDTAGRAGVDRQPGGHSPYSGHTSGLYPSFDNPGNTVGAVPGYGRELDTAGSGKGQLLAMYDPAYEHRQNTVENQTPFEHTKRDPIGYCRPLGYTESGRYGYDRPLDHTSLWNKDSDYRPVDRGDPYRPVDRRDPYRPVDRGDPYESPYIPRFEPPPSGVARSDIANGRFGPGPYPPDSFQGELDSRNVPHSGMSDHWPRPPEYRNLQNDDDFQRGGAHRHRREGAGQDEFGRLCTRR